MRRLLTALALLVAACSPGETAGSTTTPSTSMPIDTTTAASPVTTNPTTTTTTIPSTTTTVPPTTTTIADLEGNWADGPLVTTDFVALGWWDGSEWLDAEAEGSPPGGRRRGLPGSGGRHAEPDYGRAADPRL